MNESDANTYIDVHGKHLSIATARMYLAELSSGLLHTTTIGTTVTSVLFLQQASSNLQEKVYFNCWVDIRIEVILDPMHLLEKQKEIKDKRKSWKYDLYVQVQISDATTEVNFIE